LGLSSLQFFLKCLVTGCGHWNFFHLITLCLNSIAAQPGNWQKENGPQNAYSGAAIHVQDDNIEGKL
ncbi:MAG: hypothetical protein AAGA76_04450, partial [Pseudomonadota bacterium]